MKREVVSAKPHPFTFYTYLSRFLYLLIIPLLQHFLLNPQSLWEHIGTTALNIAFIAVVFWFALLEFRSIYYRQTESVITFRKGAVINRSFRLPAEQVGSLYVHSNPLFRVFRSVKIHFTTKAMYDGQGVTFITSKAQGDKIVHLFVNNRRKEIVHKSRLWKIFLICLTWSNTVTGLLVLSPFINRVGTIFGEEYKNLIYETMDLTDYILVFNLPPALASVAGVLLAGYALAVVIQVMRFGRFNVVLRGTKLIVSKGIGIKSCCVTDINDMNGVTVKQSLLMILFRIYTVYSHSLSSSRIKGDNQILIPVTNRQGVSEVLQSVHNIQDDYCKTARPVRHRIYSFLYLPLICFAGVIAGGMLMYRSPIYPDFVDLFLLLFIPATVVWVLFRIMAFKHEAVFVGGTTVKLKTFYKMNLFTTVIPKNRIQKITVRQNLVQKWFGTCHLQIVVRSSYKRKFTVMHLEYRDAQGILNKLRLGCD